MHKLPVSVRLELSVEETRHQVIHHLQAHHKEIEDAVAAEMQQLIDSGALKTLIRTSVRKHLNHAIDEGVKRALTSWSRESPTVREAIEKSVHEALWTPRGGE